MRTLLSLKKCSFLALCFCILLAIFAMVNFSEVFANESVKNIYLNGMNGDDNNDGSTIDKPLKTLAKAKEIAKEDKTIKNIIVSGTVSIEGEISLSETEAKILREANFKGYLFKLETNKNASLSNIIIDGNSENNNSIEKSLILLSEGSTLNLGEGTVLRNNKIQTNDKTFLTTKGGAVESNKATLNMTDGLIEENQAVYGGGIYLNKSTMNFTGGTIQKILLIIGMTKM